MYGIPLSIAPDGLTPSAPVPSAGEEFLMLSFRLSCQPPSQWAQQTFAQADLGDRRRARRAASIAEAMAEQPGASIPCLFEQPYGIKAAYSLFDRPEATPDRLQASPRPRAGSDADPRPDLSNSAGHQ